MSSFHPSISQKMSFDDSLCVAIPSASLIAPLIESNSDRSCRFPLLEHSSFTLTLRKAARGYRTGFGLHVGGRNWQSFNLLLHFGAVIY
jgi:hypothetical protein